MLGAAECYRCIKPVDIFAALVVLPELPFEPANIGSTNPEKSPCHVYPAGRPLPDEVIRLVAGLGLGGVTRRILVRKLMPGQGMAAHVDRWLASEAGWRRFHVPLLSDPRVVMRWPDDGEEVYLAPGWLYEVRYDRRHEVVNEATGERVHVQIDQAGATI